MCPEEPEADKHELGAIRSGEIAFVGFNNASFKNDNIPVRVTAYKDRQLQYVRQVARRVEPDDIRSAYIFYHIPELDDPHVVLNFDTETPGKREANKDNPYPYSSWFVDSLVHDEWKNVVRKPKVRGLFAAITTTGGATLTQVSTGCRPAITSRAASQNFISVPRSP